MNYRPYAIGAAMMLACGQALAGKEDDALKSYGQCADIRDDPARLACYDSLAPQMKAALAPPAEAPPPVAAETPAPPVPQAATPVPEATPPAAVASASPPVATPPPAEQESWFGRNVGSIFGTEPAQQTTPEKFGSDQLPPPETAPPNTPQEIDSISANVSDVAFTPFGKFIVFLDNGQIWRQVEGDSDRAHFKKNPKDNKVTISRGSIGSYNLTINDSAKLFKVTRVK